MPVSTEYVARETIGNLWRNRLMTIAAVLTVAVSLSLVGAALLLRQGAANAEGVWQRETQVTVWMQPNASKAQVQGVGTRLRQLPYVASCGFRNQASDFAEAKRLIGSDEVTASGLTPGSIPSSWRCTPSQPLDVQLVIDQFSGQPGVLNVTAPLSQIRTMENVISILQWAFLAVAVILLLSASVLILNTIRMAIFARRREVSVMKLVGATNWFIRVPFMSEGLFQGLLGSVVAGASVIGLAELVNHFGSGGSALAQMRMSTLQILGTEVIVVLVGLVIGTVGSAVAIRRFLDV